MKRMVLTGGTGSRLNPLTLVAPQHYLNAGSASHPCRLMLKPNGGSL